jgi:hypothetical protein
MEGNDCDLIKISMQDFEETKKETVNGVEEGSRSVGPIV